MGWTQWALAACLALAAASAAAEQATTRLVDGELRAPHEGGADPVRQDRPVRQAAAQAPGRAASFVATERLVDGERPAAAYAPSPRFDPNWQPPLDLYPNNPGDWPGQWPPRSLPH